jgi:hypothetical protein
MEILRGENPELLANQKGQKRQILYRGSGFLHVAKFYELLNKFNKISQFLRPPPVRHLSQIGSPIV